jgi:hypothetical protein
MAELEIPEEFAESPTARLQVLLAFATGPIAVEDLPVEEENAPIAVAVNP